MIGLLVTAVWSGPLSGITVGFGAVLLGITIDFGLHVYFALLYGEGSGPEQRLAAVSRPVLYGGFTSLAAFSVLLFSALPGQRQLAIFAIAGIISALLLALIVLPHFIGTQKTGSVLPRHTFRRHIYDRLPGLRIVVLVVWFVGVGWAAWQAQNLAVNGELKQLSYLPREIVQAEQQLSEYWGNMRGRALLFAEGRTLEEALERNEQAWGVLGEQGLQNVSVSLAPLLPTAKHSGSVSCFGKNFGNSIKRQPWNCFRPVVRNMDFPPPLLSRFRRYWIRLRRSLTCNS